MSDDLDFEVEVRGTDDLESLGSDTESSKGKTEVEPSVSIESDKTSKAITRDAEWGALGIPPEEWGIDYMSNRFSVVKESVDPSSMPEEKEVVLYSMPAFDEGREPVVTKAGTIGSKKFRVPPHALLFPKLNIGKQRFWLVQHNHSKPALCSTEYWPLVPKEELNLEYYHQLFGSRAFVAKPRLSTSSTTNSHQRIKSNLFEKVRIPLPPLPEQRKIVSVLHAVDQAIQKTEEIIDQAKRVKRGLMQKLFRDGTEEAKNFQSTQYGPAPSHWSVRQISELATQIQAGGTPDTSKEEYYGGQIPWIRTGELRQKRIRSPEKCITEAGFQNSTARLFSKGTVLVAMYGATAGESAMLEVEATSNQACCGVVTDEKTIYPEFLFQQLLYLKRNLIALGAGSGQQNISKGIISNFRVLVPPSEEQRKIASMLKKWDEEIEVGEQHRNGLKRLKKGLMQDLLTGDVRTADKAIEVLGEVEAHG